MVSRRSLIFALLGAILWNAALSGAGVLMVCTHEDGQVHFTVQSEPCEEPCDDDAEAGDCEDLTLSSVDLLAPRQDVQKLMHAPLALPSVVEPVVPQVTVVTRLIPPLRGPPAAYPRIHISVPTTVLLI